ncbi:hypothetical protein [Bradyrhizobium sp. CCBAU 11357]|uniref:hypothetical protein n=1 Tax=Bradyrhizobium sp. CCBAU 11357 TaxID=1630808 RepID=UPI002303ADDD|nr:hypothetical protein [Bradyrhizobium sp. CCBAU 11357]
MLSQPVVRRLVLARYLFELALQNVRSQQETGDAACVSLLQDATEIFFVAALDHLNVQQSKPKTEFPQLLDKLSEALGADLPYRRRLLEVNRVRVAAKHDGIFPNRKEIDGYVTDTRKFLEEVCQKALGVDFWTVSLVDLLDDDEAKTFLQAAEASHRKADYVDCLVNCRKAFFVTFETWYDTQKDLNNTFGLFGSRAPYFARDREYIKKNVRDHFDYIVLDHSQIDRDLTKEGIDHTAFWNVWRLTPEVYRHKKEDVWRIKHDPRRVEPSGSKERSTVALSAMTSILLARQNTARATRYIGGSSYSDVKAKAGTTFYEKADKSSPVAGHLPEGEDQISISYATQGLNDDDWYWSAMFAKPGEPPLLIVGYVLDADLIPG